MWIKICGNTNLEDAAMAAELGADAVGFVFATSRRRVSVAEVAAITAALADSVQRVGVFDVQRHEEIVEVAAEARLSAVQLHCEVDVPGLERLRQALPAAVEMIPTLHWSVEDDGSAADRIRAQLGRIAATGLVRRVLIDSRVNGASGGTGKAFDWAGARNVFRESPSELELILAGGLRPESVGAAVLELRPAGVDVSSGVEAAVRRKDRAKMAEFLRRARSAAGG